MCHRESRQSVGWLTPTPFTASLLFCLAMMAAPAFCVEVTRTAIEAGTFLSQPAYRGTAPAREPAVVTRSAAIALVLPLQSPVYAAAAEAVRAGFMAAATSAGSQHRVIVISYADDGVLPAFEAARDAQVAWAVGPLTRDDLKILVTMGLEFLPTLALNRLDDDTPLPPQMFSLSLAVEGEGRQLARLARVSGLKSIAIVVNSSPLQRRLANAFRLEWGKSPGERIFSLVFTPGNGGLSVLRAELAQAGADGLLMAVDPGEAALVKSVAGRARVYAGSQIHDGQSPEQLRDLEGVVLVELPWLVSDRQAELARLRTYAYADAALSRLYALGLDAFRVVRLLMQPGTRLTREIDGATGRISHGEGRQFLREGQVVIVRDGSIVPADPPR